MTNKFSLKDVAELIGISAVVVSLVFLIIEVRDNSRALEQQSALARAEAITAPYFDSDLATVLTKVIAVDGDFGLTDRMMERYDLTTEVLDDDRIVLCGSQPSFPFDSASLVFLLRYTADGDLDPTLDGDGIVAFEWPGRRLSNCLALDILPGNAMLVTGYGSSATDTSILLSRFNADGSLDTSYGASGAREITSDDICAAYDCEGLDVRIDPGSLDSVVSRGLSYTTFLVRVRR